ncbi:coiled-coil domain-containing 74B-like isoform X1 [Brachionus plicatilis]|uniref:Coiled-coil domain-containing 74B-like isoform X1 n=1 Tax=Brachionus plicatilis TaxID=10195 RepID=A0A3M7Q6P3_BRAPC|nr:coiled-coil domain-containing 74B-like isoform X1 [Brachionus plicatilis]
MLKQTLVQEKLSDLTMAAQTSVKPGSKLDGDIKKSTGDILIPHAAQYARLQLIKTSSSTSSSKFKLKSANYSNESTSANPKINLKPDDDNEETLEYDGVETVNFYSNYHGQSSSNEYTSQGHNNGAFAHENRPTSNKHSKAGSANPQNRNIRIISDSNQYDPNLKLKYLEKSIKFIQQQHTETLNSLHQEIEKLKDENRELHFKLATRKSSSSLNNSLTNSKQSFKQEVDKGKNEVIDDRVLHEKIEKNNFDKVLKNAFKEKNLDKRLEDLKTNFESSKFDDLFARLVDAENKNEYLTNLLTQLQAKRSTNTEYKTNNVNSTNTAINPITKININQIYSIDPLRIKMSEAEEPRAPSLQESEIIIKKLFDIYKQQKQQISNMKVVLKDLMQNENLSNQAMLLTKDLLENSNKLSHYVLDKTNVHKLSVLAPLNNLPKSSNARLNFNPSRYHSQLLTTTGLGYDSIATGSASLTTASSNVNLPSIVHLPPLQTINPVKFPERQRRTQILQKQRLRKEYYH